MPDTRVHHAVQQVDQQVDEDNHRRHQQHPALHHRIIATLQRVDQPATSRVPTCRPITVTTGSIALRSAWITITRIRVRPLARAVRI